MPPKKSSKKKKKPKKRPGHYCRVCGRRRANEKFSGKGHTTHICKDCAKEQRAGAKKKRKIAASPRTEKNFFAGLPTALPEELIENVFQTEQVRIERIVSTGQSSPPGFWYDQDEGEWVILLRGGATLEFKGKTQMRHLAPGDYVYIPPHQKHRVFSTSEKQTTVWLAVFVKENSTLPTGKSPMQITVTKNPSAETLDKLGCRSRPIWERESSTFPWHYDERETCLILEGKVTVTPKDGEAVTFGKGDLVVFPQGMDCTWNVQESVRKHYKFG